MNIKKLSTTAFIATILSIGTISISYADNTVKPISSKKEISVNNKQVRTLSGWVKEGGKWYYLDENFYEGKVNHGSYLINGKMYVFDENGALIQKKGWICVKNLDGTKDWYYGNGDGTIKVEQWIKDSGKWYYVDACACMASHGSRFIDGKHYIFDENGAMIKRKGWIKVKPKHEPGEMYKTYYWYYGNGDGTIKVNQWIKENGKWYYLSGENDEYSYGFLNISTSVEINGKMYVFDENGVMIVKKGWIKVKDIYLDCEYTKWYYGNGDGTVKTEQWIKDNGNWYYVDPQGYMVSDRSENIYENETVNQYTFDKNGVCLDKY